MKGSRGVRISGLPFGKWFDGVLAVFCSFCILAAVSSIFVGFDLTVGNIRSREIRLNAAEVKITGKAYDPSVRIVGGKEVIHADCRMGMGRVCAEYHGETLYAENLRIVVLNDRYYAVAGGTLHYGSDELTIESGTDDAALLKEFADDKRIYPKFFLMGAVVLLPFLLILFVLKRSAK